MWDSLEQAGIIEAAVGQDVGFDALEDAEIPAIASVKPIDGACLRDDFFHRKAARVMRGFGVIRDPEVLVSARARRFRHDVERVDAIREVGMSVHDAADVRCKRPTRSRERMERALAPIMELASQSNFHRRQACRRTGSRNSAPAQVCPPSVLTSISITSVSPAHAAPQTV
jgi:hypothetical protein